MTNKDMIIKKFIDNKSNYLLGAFLLLGIVAYLFGSNADAELPVILPNEAGPSVDTFIPKGFVLVPLEISNAESLTSLVGDMGGVVDLYLPSNEKQKGGLKVGAKLKLLRAPLNPQQYAVLVRENQSAKLLSFAGPFIAVVQNPDETGTQITQSAKRSFKIDYQN